MAYYGQPDHTLTLTEKVKLIKGIEYYQKERMERIRRYWKDRHRIPAGYRALISMTIKTIREQEIRLKELKKSLNN